MIKFILGIVGGIVIGNVGLSGLIKIVDSSVSQTKTAIEGAVR